jgi:RNA polymerase sigma factor (TIGR02999 family)
MRNILVDQARRKAAHKHGGGAKRVELADDEPSTAPPDASDSAAAGNVIALNEALSKLEQTDPRKAELVMLHHFAGLTMEEAATAMGVSLSTAEREWRFTRALLYSQLAEHDGEG